MLNGTEISSLYRQRIRNTENMLALISQHCAAVHVWHYDEKNRRKFKKIEREKKTNMNPNGEFF